MIKRLAILFLLQGLLSCAAAEASDEKDIDTLILQQAKKFRVLLQTIHGHYVDSVDIEKLSEKAFNEMLKDLDPASAYFPAKVEKELEDEQEGEETGIGAKLVSLNDTVHVFDIIEGSPADSAGLERADKILFIDGKNIAGRSPAEVYGMIKGEPGTEVSIIAKRGYGSALQEYKIERNLYPLSTVSTYFIIDGTDVGYINISRFSGKSHDEFLKASKELKNKGMKKLIIDLRGNPGGFLRTASRIVDEFIPPGRKIVYTDARNPDYRQEQLSTASTEFPEMPLIILVDSTTVSAAEALAGAIQDLDRGLIAGERTYGKGSAQKTWNFNDGSAFRLTIAEYHTPSGRSIQKHREQAKESPELDPALEMEKSREEIEKIRQKIIETGGKRLPVYQTEGGRTVIGGGGIIPDYIVRRDTTTLLTKVLIKKGILLEFAYHFVYSNRGDLDSLFGDDYQKYAAKFNVSNELMEVFRRFCYLKKTFNEDMYKIDRETLKRLLKAEIARTLWGSKGYAIVMAAGDNPIQTAVKLFPQATKLLEVN